MTVSTSLLGSLGRLVLLLSVMLLVVSYGGVYPVPFLVVFLLASLSLVFAFLEPLPSQPLTRISGLGLLFAAAAVALVLLQVVSVPEALGHPSWEAAAALLGDVNSHISVDRGATLQALPRLLLPFLIFVAAVTLFSSDERAVWLWRSLAGFGAALAAYGIVQYVAFPGWLLTAPKEHYLDSLTGTFINRNTAATFFGLSAVLACGCTFLEWERLRERTQQLQRSRNAVAGPVSPRPVISWALALLILIVALMMTRSRAGIAATFVALAFMAIALIHAHVSKRQSRSQRILWTAASIVGLVLLFAMLAGRALLRFETKGVEDARWCAYEYTIAAIRDHPWLGTGFAAFQSIFPSYRIGECVPYGEWAMGHSVYLEAYLAFGAPFLILLLALLAALLQTYRRGYRGRIRYRFAPIGGVSLLLLVALHSTIDFSLQVPGLAAYFAAATAACVVISIGRHRRVR